jgi:hypothetical protein
MYTNILIPTDGSELNPRKAIPHGRLGQAGRCQSHRDDGLATFSYTDDRHADDDRGPRRRSTKHA